jgi:hypothetical protein
MFMLKPDMPNYLSRHDVVYLSPPTQGWEGLPLGNGSMGGLIWTSEEGLNFQVNHTDTYETIDCEDIKEPWTVLRSCGQLKIQHAVPMHNWLYLNDYEARLEMHSAKSKFIAKTAFGTFETQGYVHAQRPVAIFHHQATYAGDLAQSGAPLRILLERWGSRVGGWWYAAMQGGANVGLGSAKCKSSIDGNDACMEISFRGVSVALRCRLLGARSRVLINHDHQVEIVVDAASKQSVTILLACVTSHDDPQPTRAAKKAIESAAAETHLERDHLNWWADYWSRSFIHISQDYFENLYYLHLYLLASSSRGKFPPLFNGGIFLWNHDVRNWVNPHHWNEQQLFWCLPTANHADLLKPYLDTYHRLMPEAIASTKRRGFQGMLWVDQHDFSGRQVAEDAPSFRDNYTPASQIAMFFWWHYQSTGDGEYLREKGYPFMKAAGEFYLNFLQWKSKENLYQIPSASTYEDERPWRFTDSITNLAMIRGLFRALIETCEVLQMDDVDRSRWQHVLDHLPAYRVNDRDTLRGPTLASGLVDGKNLPEKENHNHGPIFCPIFPAGDLGLKDEGTKLFEAACNSLTTYPTAAVAITPVVAIAARLGMTDEALKRLTTIVRNLQHFPNGLFYNIDHWWYLSRRAPQMELGFWSESAYWAARGYQLDETTAYQRDYLADRECRYKNVRVIESPADGIHEHRADLPVTPFIQMGMETLGHFAAGLQEMLLQSHEGIIRVFPAIPNEWEGSFTLLAAGGFLVTSHRQANQLPTFIQITSQRGGSCRVSLPWPSKVEVLDEQNSRIAESLAGILTLETASGRRYLVCPFGSRPDSYEINSQRNTTPKNFHEASIGKSRNF